jgi:hypothetical protein
MNVPAGGVEEVGEGQRINSRFAALYDDNYLYLAAEVSDDVLVVNIAPDDLEAFYRTDSIEFYLDPNRSGAEVGLFKLAVLPFDTEGHVQAVRHEDARPGPISETSPGTEVASLRSEDGYIIEVAIPLSELGITEVSEAELGFTYVVHNTSVADAEVGADARENILSLNPVPNVWANPDAWSTLRFE